MQRYNCLVACFLLFLCNPILAYGRVLPVELLLELNPGAIPDGGSFAVFALLPAVKACLAAKAALALAALTKAASSAGLLPSLQPQALCTSCHKFPTLPPLSLPPVACPPPPAMPPSSLVMPPSPEAPLFQVMPQPPLPSAAQLASLANSLTSNISSAVTSSLSGLHPSSSATKSKGGQGSPGTGSIVTQIDINSQTAMVSGSGSVNQSNSQDLTATASASPPPSASPPSAPPPSSASGLQPLPAMPFPCVKCAELPPLP